MKKITFFVTILSVLGISCSRTEKTNESTFEEVRDTLAQLKHTHEKPAQEISVNLDSIKRIILAQSNHTKSYTFSLEGNFSAEGNEGKASYRNNKIDKVEITFYGESGKNTYVYQFKNNTIEVVQQRYDYKTNFMEVKSADDIIKGEKVKYTLDLNGKMIDGNKTELDSDVFFDLQKAIPFDLN